MKPHVAFLPSPGMGNTIPLFELAKRLVIQHGFRVSFLFITTGASPAQHQLLRSPSLPQDLHIIDLPEIDVSKIVTPDMPVLTSICLIIQESLLPLRSILVGLDRLKALVVDIFCTDAFEVCRELSIPAYSFFTASTILLTFSLYLPTLDHELEGEFGDLTEPVCVPGGNPIRAEDLLYQVHNRKMDDYKWYLLHSSRLAMAAGIFVNSWDQLEPVWLKALKQDPFYKSIHTPPIYPIGPLTKEEEPMKDSDAEILSWLDFQGPNSVLLVALGSGGTLTSDQLTELAFGLEMSQQRFILVARTPSNASGSGAFFSVGSDPNDPATYLPEGFMERSKGVGLVVRSFAPQVSVLRHASTGGFLSHCGWNSTLESISHGVPMIALPLYAEQRMNATMLSEDVGVAVKLEKMEREEIGRLVRLVMEGEEGRKMRSKARELQLSARETTSRGGSSYELLHQIIELWRS